MSSSIHHPGWPISNGSYVRGCRCDGCSAKAAERQRAARRRDPERYREYTRRYRAKKQHQQQSGAALSDRDPPYLGSTRSANYRHELASDSDHTELLTALLNCRAAVVVSGYPSPLYDTALDGWGRVEMAAWTGNGIRNGATKTEGDRVEVLWSNRRITERHLFDGITA